MTKAEWGACAAILANFYPHNFKLGGEPDRAGDDEATKRAKERASAQMNLWFQALADLPGDRVKAAIWSMVRTQPAFPSVADIRRLAEGAADAASEAWAEALRLATGPGAVPEHCPYVPNGRIEVIDGKVRRLDPQLEQSVPLAITDPILAKTITAIGGLAVLAFGELAGIETRRAQFLKLYQGFAAEHKRRDTFAAMGVPADARALPEGPTADTPTRLGAIARHLTPPHHQEEMNP